MNSEMVNQSSNHDLSRLEYEVQLIKVTSDDGNVHCTMTVNNKAAPGNIT